MKRERKKLLRLNDEENQMLLQLSEIYKMSINETIRYLIRKEYEKMQKIEAK
ncbi:MAG: hypothetical protein RXR43_15540 [Sulfolobus sp.]